MLHKLYGRNEGRNQIKQLKNLTQHSEKIGLMSIEPNKAYKKAVLCLKTKVQERTLLPKLRHNNKHNNNKQLTKGKHNERTTT